MLAAVHAPPIRSRPRSPPAAGRTPSDRPARRTWRAPSRGLAGTRDPRRRRRGGRSSRPAPARTARATISQLPDGAIPAPRCRRTSARTKGSIATGVAGVTAALKIARQVRLARRVHLQRRDGLARQHRAQHLRLGREGAVIGHRLPHVPIIEQHVEAVMLAAVRHRAARPRRLEQGQTLGRLRSVAAPAVGFFRS